MASASRSQRPYAYLDAFLATIPDDAIPHQIASTSRGADSDSSPYPKFLDAALRLVAGGPSRPDDAPHLRDAWPEIQASIQRTLHALHHSSSPPPPSLPTQPPNTKRKHPASSSSPATTNQKKKPKVEQAGGADEGVDDDDGDDDDDDDDDIAHLTLHALSTTAPVRHKVDITLCARTLRLTHSTTGAGVGRCARPSLTRAFLLPTRARSSGALQWAALLLAGDKPAPPAPKKKAARGLTTDTTRFELACTVTDSSSASAVPRMTLHAPTSASAPASPSQPTTPREALLALLTSTISGTPVTLTTAERGAPLAGIAAFRGVRETSLWFFDGAGAGAGILADARPAEFWAVADLARGEAGVRVRTATGRTCSVVLTRLATPENDGKDGDGDGDEDEEMGEGDGEEGEETEFQMIDGKEREGILEWVRKYRNAFGISKAQRGAREGDRAAAAADRKAMDGEGMDAGGDSDSDSDFEASSMSSDGGSPSSSPGSGSGSGSDDAGSDAGSVAAASGESGGDVESERGSQDEDDEDDDKEVVELDPKHHPLLRAGALPKMSRAAMDAAVGLVVGDLLEDAQVREHDDGDEEEEDELDD